MESDIFGKVEFDSDKPQKSQEEEKEEDTPF
jgi:hypothetical protein